MDDKIIYSKRKPKACPKCNSKSIARYFYGMPIYSEQLQEQISSGEIVIGGCEMDDNNPSWKCNKCRLDIFYESID